MATYLLRLLIANLVLAGLMTACKSSPAVSQRRDMLISGAVEQPGFYKLQLAPGSTIAEVVGQAGGIYPARLRDDAFAATLVFENNGSPRKYVPAREWQTSFKKLGVDVASCTEVRVERIR